MMTLNRKNCKIHEYFFFFERLKCVRILQPRHVMLTVCEYTVYTSDVEKATLYLISPQGHNIAIQATIKTAAGPKIKVFK